MPNESRDRFAQFAFKQNEHSSIKNIIAVMSGKGGVGKSLVTSILAVNQVKLGKKVAILDGDITGPSIPMMFGLNEQARASETELFPSTTSLGIKVMSLNLVNEDKTAPVVWRGPVVAGIIKQFYEDVSWGEIDTMFVDMPPGTSDVPLTVFQSLPIKAIVVVATPQDLVAMIVEKALKMAKMMDVPVIGLIENMAYMECPCCKNKLYPFGEPHDKLTDKYGIPYYEAIPIDNRIASSSDKGEIESLDMDLIKDLSIAISKIP